MRSPVSFLMEERWCTVHVLAWNRLDLRNEQFLAKPPGSHSLATRTMKKNPACLGYIGAGMTLSSHVGIIIDHYQDPYKATSIMESKRVLSWLTCIF